MKNNIRSFIFITPLFMLSLLAVMVGCKKDLGDKLTPADGEAKLVFTVKGMNNSFSTINSKLASTSDLKNSNSEEHALLNQALNNKVNLVTQAIEHSRASNFEFANTLSKYKKNSKLATAIPVDHDIRFRLLVFDSQTDTLVSNIEAKINETLSISVTPGRSYYWRAYTHNSKEAMAPLNLSADGFEIETAVDKDILWAGSTNPITVNTVADSLGIIFDYKVGEFVVNIDPNDLYGEITDLAMEFDQNDYFKKGILNLKTGNISNITTTTSSELSLAHFKAIADTKMLQAKFYTADPSNMTNLVINVKKISVKQDGATASREIHKATDPSRAVSFSFTNPTIAKSHHANMVFRYKIPTKTILHVTGDNNTDEDTKFSFAAQPATRDLSTAWSSAPGVNRPPFNMIKTARNFGTLSNSIVYTDGFEHRRCITSGTLNQMLNPPNGRKPDIVIMTLYYVMTPADIDALLNYVNANGVLIMMTDSAIPEEVAATERFFRRLFNNNGIVVSAAEGYDGGTMFRLRSDIDEMIMNGKFGNLGGLLWGVDTRNVVTASNLPIGTGINEVTLWSEIQPVNKTSNTNLGASMFKHNSKNIFWIGNGTFLSTQANESLNIRELFTTEPFGIVNESNSIFNNPNPVLNYNYYPIPKRYGSDFSTASIGNSYGSLVYNAPLFANLMNWAVYQSEFFGTNKN